MSPTPASKALEDARSAFQADRAAHGGHAHDARLGESLVEALEHALREAHSENHRLVQRLDRSGTVYQAPKTH